MSIESDWQMFYDVWKARLLIYAKQQTRNPQDAEDVLQEAMVRAWRRRSEFGRVEPAHVFNQIRRLAIDYYRREDRRKLREQAYKNSSEETDRICSYFEESESSAILQACLNGLPKDQEEVLVLKIWAEMTFEEIGKILCVSPNTAASRYRYGLKRLKALMEKETAYEP